MIKCFTILKEGNMKVKFAVYAYRNVPYEEETFRISGDFESIEEALNFKSLAEKTEIRSVLMTKELFVSTIIESLGDKINISKIEPHEKYTELLMKYDMLDCLH